MRRRQVEAARFWRAAAEGVLWGAAFWVKPHVAVPALFVWLAAARLAQSSRRATYRELAIDAGGVVLGGLLVGAVGIAWLVWTGAWSSFVEMQTVWNREYFGFNAMSGQGGVLYAGLAVRFFPWLLIHLAAAPLALKQLVQGRTATATLFAALYLGWFFQSVALQHLFDYVQLPAVMLGFALVFGFLFDPAAETESDARIIARRLFTAFAGLCVAFSVYWVGTEAFAAWPRCWTEGSSPAVRDQLARLHKVNWRELQRVTAYLRDRGVQDGELTCFPLPLMALYRELDVEPASRYRFLQANWVIHRQQRARIYRELAESRQRFVVCDLLWEGIDLKEPKLELLPPRWEKWKKRIVFQAERYIVLEITGSDDSAWLTECFPD